MKQNKIQIFFYISILIFGLSCNKSSNNIEDEIDEGDYIIITPTDPPTPTYDVSKLSIEIPCEGNSWVVDNPLGTSNIIGVGGIKNWSNSNDKIRTYFYVKSTGKIDIGFNAKFSDSTTLKVTFGGKTKNINFSSSSEYKKIYIDSFDIDKSGYYFVELEGVATEGDSFGNISDILVGESNWNSKISYVEQEWFYWGRRGPSVHLGYEEPTNKNITWFYNEMTVPVDSDPIGSYYMANGFSDGYFGMQVNSETERRVLFSVWSAFDTQDPNQIPTEYTVLPLGNGSEVTVKEFGGEGSGAQSYMIFDWTPGTTYKFLLKGESKVNNTIDYTAYFYAPEIGDWRLISSFRRPYPTSSHLTSLYSFLENFNTVMGDSPRKVEYTNQWVFDTEGTWSEMTTAKYTTDNTGSSGVRFDYDGGLGTGGNNFYLRNCGFFSDNETPNTSFTRTASGTPPNVDFTQLEVPSFPENIVLDRSNWSIVDYSTQEDNGGEGNTGRAADILDNDLNTYWHSCWSGCTATAPHHITVDMGQTNTVDGFRFTQRQSLSRTIKDIEIQISNDNSSWESLGDFTLEKVTTNQDVNLTTAKTFRYFKYVAKTAHDGTENAALAEIFTYIIK